MSKNINVPSLRFKEFSGEWEEKKLGDIDRVSKELKELEISMKKTDKTIEAFCSELGIATPF
ncbi:MAG: hypothetical protein GX118_07280 [Arcobacter butzleri]|jgi:hypothetical protein|nr:hypothetical protein [Arcobacteraceae bacterium]MDY0365669.1 hypothetical protein [Arcobacteraceae bacterium]NLO17975.1 hypothetical protein [Aliarcobacter butzleri]